MLFSQLREKLVRNVITFLVILDYIILDIAVAVGSELMLFPGFFSSPFCMNYEHLSLISEATSQSKVSLPPR